ncbi:Transcriptional regulator, GntR family (plasmid) [Cupriavidus necator H850]|uniref:GntR family transcriptional regulator n=1 Tax=Cupriavidus necator TaxID=106590 RepID=UPI00129E7C77|nr:GntR family transcriptional regulator [Cupriavidus necator]KAI3610245.1 Transcriptional regulator, GntR family [Cupriavidus necator H850]
MASLLNQQPRYLQLAQTLLNEIQSGQQPVGSQLPTEYELCEQFGVSRFTVREAIKQLVQMGLVARQPRLGTKVVAAAPVAGYRQVMGELTDLRQYTAETELDIEEAGVVELPRQAGLLAGAGPGERWLRAAGVRRTSEHSLPICFTEVFIHPAFRSLSGLVGRTHTPIFSMIEQQFGEHIAKVVQEIRAVAIPEDMAKVLSVEPSSPALCVSRLYSNRKDQIVEVAISTHPADRFTYSQTFQRDWQAG